MNIKIVVYSGLVKFQNIGMLLRLNICGMKYFLFQEMVQKIYCLYLSMMG